MNRPDLDALQALVDQAHPDNATDARRWADVLGACAQVLRSLPELIAYVRQLERDEAALRAERDALAAAMPSEGADAAIGYAAMKAECDALRADAERYQQLRSPHPRWEVRYWTGRWWETLQTTELDAAIDAARKP